MQSDASHSSGCCTPARALDTPPPGPAEMQTSPAALAQLRALGAPIPGGRAEVGTNRPFIPQDGEGPQRQVPVAPFLMSRTCVTNSQFADFVEETGYITEAERFGWSFVFFQYLPRDVATVGVANAGWWRRSDGAQWRAPTGPQSDLDGLDDYPVVHVSWNDAVAFAHWAGARLPTEAEWEHAARGGLKGKIYPWGDEHPDEAGFQPCNIWQGVFPTRDDGLDGYPGLAPAQSFAPNPYGLFNMVGNCWEWSADRFRVRSLSRVGKQRDATALAGGERLLKGGSHMCHASYCHRYRIAARIGNTPDSTTGHMGFRLVFDL